MKELKTWKEVAQAIMDGEEVEVFNEFSEKWVDVLHFPHFRIIYLPNTPNNRYRIKPRTIKIGDMEVPEPARDVSELEKGEAYYFLHFHRERLYDFYTWNGGDLDLRLLKHGMVHKTEEAAILHAKALIKISGGSRD